MGNLKKSKRIMNVYDVFDTIATALTNKYAKDKNMPESDIIEGVRLALVSLQNGDIESEFKKLIKNNKEKK